MTIDQLPRSPEFLIEEVPAEKTTLLVRHWGTQRGETVDSFAWHEYGRQGAFQRASKRARELVSLYLENVA